MLCLLYHLRSGETEQQYGDELGSRMDADKIVIVKALLYSGFDIPLQVLRCSIVIRLC